MDLVGTQCSGRADEAEAGAAVAVFVVGKGEGAAFALQTTRINEALLVSAGLMPVAALTACSLPAWSKLSLCHK